MAPSAASYEGIRESADLLTPPPPPRSLMHCLRYDFELPLKHLICGLPLYPVLQGGLVTRITIQIPPFWFREGKKIDACRVLQSCSNFLFIINMLSRG